MVSRCLSARGATGGILLLVMSGHCAAVEPVPATPPLPASASAEDAAAAENSSVVAEALRGSSAERSGVQQAEDSPTERRKTSVRTGPQLRAAYVEIVRATARRAEYEPLEVAPVALRLFIELAQARDISHAERTRMQSRLKVRLTQLRNRLIRDQKRQERDAAPVELADGEQPHVRRSADASRNQPESSSLGDSSLGGGGNGEAAQARELIGLIENTIAPDTWDSRGGRGTIRYFSLLRVLVVRQTGEVHHQLGGALDVLRD